MTKEIEAIDKIVKRMVEISDSRLCKQLNANLVMLRNSLLTQPADVQERAKEYANTTKSRWGKTIRSVCKRNVAEGLPRWRILCKWYAGRRN